MQFRHTTLITISGLIWMAIGTFLLTLGLNLLVGVIELRDAASPLVNSLANLFGRNQSVILLIAVGLAIGYFKGRYVLAKSAKRVVTRILGFPNPTSLANLYSLPYYILIAGMMGLGMCIKFFGIPSDIRGVIDVAIGAALINGAMIYFRLAMEEQKEAKLKAE